MNSIQRLVAPAALLAALACAAHSSAGVIVSEDFESYATTAAMQANWGSTGAGTLDTATGNPGQSASHPGGTVNSWIGSSISLTPTAANPIVLTADIYDDADSSNERNTIGFRNGANPLFEMGHYNGTAEHYHVRVLGMYGSDNWVPLAPGLAASTGGIQAGWNRYQATFTDTSLTVTLDLGADGSIDGSFTSVGSPSANPFVDLRFGGPSNLSSPGPINVDNISLVVIPEPASMMLASLAIVGLLALTRRR
jgi:PEP-CTERM motif